MAKAQGWLKVNIAAWGRGRPAVAAPGQLMLGPAGPPAPHMSGDAARRSSKAARDWKRGEVAAHVACKHQQSAGGSFSPTRQPLCKGSPLPAMRQHKKMRPRVYSHRAPHVKACGAQAGCRRGRAGACLHPGRRGAHVAGSWKRQPGAEACICCDRAHNAEHAQASCTACQAALPSCCRQGNQHSVLVGAASPGSNCCKAR